MAYKNEHHLKRNEIKIRVNDDDLDVIDAIASYTRQQRAVLMREYAMREIRRLIAEGSAQTAASGRP